MRDTSKLTGPEKTVGEWENRLDAASAKRDAEFAARTAIDPNFRKIEPWSEQTSEASISSLDRLAQEMQKRNVDRVEQIGKEIPTLLSKMKLTNEKEKDMVTQHLIDSAQKTGFISLPTRAAQAIPLEYLDQIKDLLHPDLERAITNAKESGLTTTVGTQESGAPLPTSRPVTITDAKGIKKQILDNPVSNLETFLVGQKKEMPAVSKKELLRAGYLKGLSSTAQENKIYQLAKDKEAKAQDNLIKWLKTAQGQDYFNKQAVLEAVREDAKDVAMENLDAMEKAGVGIGTRAVIRGSQQPTAPSDQYEYKTVNGKVFRRLKK